MATRKPQLMAGYRKRQNLRRDMTQARQDVPLARCVQLVRNTARRVNESRQAFPWKFFRGDFHSHTQHSDGLGTVAETAAMVKEAELDFQYITDHWGITQKAQCDKHGLWVGQEPGTKHHHLGILALDHAYTPRMDLAHDYHEVLRLGGVPFIPHPTGWSHQTVYKQEQLDALNDLPQSFLMEILNAAVRVVSAYDHLVTGSAVKLWDKLLCEGRHIHVMGNTDAHMPHSIGVVWNGVLAPRCDQASILKAVRAGKSFVSEAPLLNLTCGRAGMGATLRDRQAAGPLKITVSDSAGLMRVRLIGDGQVVKTWHLDDEPVCQQAIKLPAKLKRYVRLEAVSTDGRRGYTNPIYLA